MVPTRLFSLFAAGALLADSKVVFPDELHRKASVLLPSPCEYVADVVQLVDVSWSENDVASQLKEDSAVITDYVAQQEDWRTALASFIDKPIRPLGWDLPSWTDFCFEVNSPFSDDVSPVVAEINSIYMAGGYDFPEAQLEGLLRAVISNEIGWRASKATADGVPIQRVVVLATDAIPHLEGDALKAAQKLQANGGSVVLPEPNNLTAGDMTANGPNYGCGVLDYPSVDTVGKALKDAGVIPVFLVAPPVYTCGDKNCIFPEMKRLAIERNNTDYADPEKALETYYTALIKEMDTVGVVVQMGTEFRGLGDAFIQAMTEIGTIPASCAHQKSTESPSSETTMGVTTTGSVFTVSTAGSEVGSTVTTATTTGSAVGSTVTTATTTGSAVGSTVTTAITTGSAVGSTVTTATTTGSAVGSTVTATTTTGSAVGSTVTTATTGSEVGSTVTTATTTGSEVGSTVITASTTDTETSTVASTAITTASTTRDSSAGESTENEECNDVEKCTMKINMLIEKCNGDKIEQVLVV